MSESALAKYLGEHGGVLLCPGVGGGDDDAAARRERLDERRARLGGVDDDDPARQRPEHHRPVAGREVGPDQVELRLVAVEGPVSEEDDQHQIVLPHLTAQGGEGLAHVLGGGRRARGAGSLVDQFDDLSGLEPEPRRQRVADLATPFRQLLGVGRAAGRPRHHYCPTGVAGRRCRLGRRGGRCSQRKDDRPCRTPHRHANPIRRLSAHSAPSRAMIPTRLHAPCHTSRRSGGPAGPPDVRSSGGMRSTSAART